MNGMNEIVRALGLHEFMDRSEGWGRNQGREVYQRLLQFVEDNPGTMVFRVSMKGVRRLDISFASETIVELARRYRRTKGFCLVDLTDKDLIENLDAAADKKEQPILVWHGHSANTSSHPRRSLQGAYIPSAAPAATDFASRMRPKTFASLQPTARQVLFP